MSEVVPIIYAPPVRPVRLSFYERLIALAIAGGCAGVIATAMYLRPSPDGTGTHQGLGFLACTMLATTGIPCPSCGMTTSFAWFYRGNLAASFWVQPGGFVLAWLTGMLLIYALYEGLAPGRFIGCFGICPCVSGSRSARRCLRLAGDGRS